MPELADIFRIHGPEYVAQYGDRMLPSHLHVLEDVAKCRTQELGGQLWHCQNCDAFHYSYHSCKNRHCPKCQNEQADQWLEEQQALLLPVPYFMATFTLPEELRETTRSQQKAIYNLLFRASAEALQALAADPKFVGGTIGMIGVLQTWTRDLAYHPHVHYLIPAGGLQEDKRTWRRAKEDFLMPVKALSILFRAKFRDGLKKEGLYEQIPKTVWNKDWVVHIQPVGTGQSALKYLAPYIFRVAISNRNILALKEDQVTFRYTDAESKQEKRLTLPAQEFIRRFLQHVLPKGFIKVRYYGFLATSKQELLKVIKELLNAKGLRKEKKSPQKSREFTCPTCGKPMTFVEELAAQRGPPLWSVLKKISATKTFSGA